MSINTWEPQAGSPLVLTDAAAAHIHKQLAKNPDKIGVRVSLKKSGCSGFKYELDFVNTAETGDQTLEFGAIKLFMPAEAVSFLSGTVIDYVKEGLNSSLKFNNPKAKDVCGCGESFSA